MEEPESWWNSQPGINQAVIICLAIGALMLIGTLFGDKEPTSTGTTNYTGSSVTCRELQSEFNAADARARSGHKEYSKGALDTMNETNSQMRSQGCYK